MPRRNNREAYEPLDLTPELVPKSEVRDAQYGFGRVADNQAAIDVQLERQQERAKRQAEARINHGIDWTVCIVPGCGDELTTWRGFTGPKNRRDSTMELPICYAHASVVWQQMVKFHRNDEKLAEAIADVNALVTARDRREAAAEKTKFMARQDGDIYFIRLGGMVKVGWTRDLFQRVKSYGASAELLVSYPGTRSDETNLHRQLRPALAKGREWYEDGQIIAAFIDEALAKHGMPPTFQDMWTQPKRIVAGKRHR